MNVMVIGSSGMIGRAVLQALAARGAMAVGVSRKPPSQPVQNVENLTLDRADAGAVLSAIRAHRIDTVIDMVGYTEPATSALLGAIDGEIDRYVLISSADVYRNYGLLHRREAGAPDPNDLSEAAPLRESRYPYRGAAARAFDDPAHWMDGYDKIPLEAKTQALRSDWTILRLPMVFGPGDPQQRFRWALHPLLAGIQTLDLPQPWLNWTTTYGHVDNLADAIAHSVHVDGARRRVFNIVDTPPVDHSAWLQRFAEATRWTGTVTISVDPNHPVALATASLDLTVPLKVSGRAFETGCGWTAPFALEDTVAKTVEDALRARRQTR